MVAANLIQWAYWPPSKLAEGERNGTIPAISSGRARRVLTLFPTTICRSAGSYSQLAVIEVSTALSKSESSVSVSGF